MKLICTQENFKRAIFNTERITGKQITLPILGNILLETEKGRLKLSATNLEVGVVSTIGSKIEEEGKITIPSKLLSNFVTNLPTEDKIILEAKDQILKISSGSYSAQIKGLDAHDFPIIPKLENGFLFSLPAQELKEVMSKILVCISLNETRPELTGVNVLFSDKEISLAATDSFRLAEEVITIDNKEKGDNYAAFIAKTTSIIIPASTFSEILRITSPEANAINIAIEENQIFFEIEGVLIVSRLVNGKYPEYKQIIPQKFNTRAVLKKEDMSRAVKIASAFTSSKSGEITFSINSKNKEVVIKSQSQETGENLTKLPADITGPDQEIVFNPRYVLDGINPIPTAQVAFLVNNNSSPVVIKMVDEKSGNVIEKYTYVAMPIKS
ncbi:DNA polymerase III subunit beta [bacterium BMS3Abin15]|nr:DNA polymerase III subunit beta [bacterium BMS3Abin15]HDZ85614.1 DNA polymerase III subunit beta [Candidatus Moranbacteria bacterium]